MHQEISSNLILLLVHVRVLPRRNDFHPFNKLMQHICILLHVNQKKFRTFFDITYFIMKSHFRQVSVSFQLQKYYRKIYLRTKSTASTYMSGVIFFAFPAATFKSTYEMIPIDIPSEIL